MSRSPFATSAAHRTPAKSRTYLRKSRPPRCAGAIALIGMPSHQHEKTVVTSRTYEGGYRLYAGVHLVGHVTSTLSNLAANGLGRKERTRISSGSPPGVKPHLVCVALVTVSCGPAAAWLYRMTRRV